MGWGPWGWCPWASAEPWLTCLPTSELGDRCPHLLPTFVLLAVNLLSPVSTFTPLRDENSKELSPPEVSVTSRATLPTDFCI